MGNDHHTHRIGLALLLLATAISGVAGAEDRVLCNGRDLSGWDGDPTFWRVEQGTIVGETSVEHPAPGNTFLIWSGSTLPADFELTTRVRLTAKNDEGFANSGIQVRSVVQNPATWRVLGLQADISAIPGQFGFIYDEGGPGRGAGFGEKWLVSDPVPGSPEAERKEVARKTVATFGTTADLLKGIHHRDAWNDYRVVVRGSIIQVFVNGVQTAEMDNQSTLPPLGDTLALQLHAGPPMKVEFHNLVLRPLP